ncbi:MAG: hypothetical protein ACE5IQ_00830 [Candidatus Methylomirabilales bacterium]
MKKDLGRVRRNESEEIRISLHEVDGEPHVELRVYCRSPHHGGALLPEPEAIVVPVHAYPDLCQVLEQIQDRLLKEGLVHAPPLAGMINIDASHPTPFELNDTPSPPPNAHHPHVVPVQLPFECYVLGAPDAGPSGPGAERVSGHARILSGDGAMVWLPEPFPVGSRLAVFIRMDEMIFRGQATVAEVADRPKDGNYRHGIEWLSLNPQADAALSKIMEAAR